MPKQDFEKKLNKHRKKELKCMCAACCDRRYPVVLHAPIDKEPPYRATSYPNLRPSDLVSPNCNFTIFEKTKSMGIVVSCHWAIVENPPVFLKKEDNWVYNFVCVPHAIVLWNDTETTDVAMELLEKRIDE